MVDPRNPQAQVNIKFSTPFIFLQLTNAAVDTFLVVLEMHKWIPVAAAAARTRRAGSDASGGGRRRGETARRRTL